MRRSILIAVLIIALAILGLRYLDARAQLTNTQSKLSQAQEKLANTQAQLKETQNRLVNTEDELAGKSCHCSL